MKYSFYLHLYHRDISKLCILTDCYYSILVHTEHTAKFKVKKEKKGRL